MTRPIGDMKAGLTSGAKPKLSILCRAGLVYEARGQEYGADKYARGNHHGPPPPALGDDRKRAGALRLLGYIDAAQRHLTNVADAINRALGTGGDLVAAASTRDMDGTNTFPASELPELAHAKTSLGIGISCAIDDGLLPADPGQPWASKVGNVELPQKDDPAAERARVAALLDRGVLDVERARAKLHPNDAIPEPIPTPGDFLDHELVTRTGSW